MQFQVKLCLELWLFAIQSSLMLASVDVRRSPEAVNLVKLRVDSILKMTIEACPVLKEASNHVFQLSICMLRFMKRITACVFFLIAWCWLSVIEQFTIAIVHVALSSLSLWLFL